MAKIFHNEIQRGTVKQTFRSSKISSRNFLITILVLGILTFSSGCDKKHVAMIGEKAPEISSNDIHGKLVSLDQFKGNVVVLCFWASCCCGDRVKQLEPFYHQNRDKGLKILAISEGSTRDAAESYAKSNGLTFTIQTDESGVTAREYGVFGLIPCRLIKLWRNT